MTDFKITHIDRNAARTELHDKLGLTGCEASFNTLSPGTGAPFVHCHTNNEELYGIISGKGALYIDGSVREITAGDWFAIGPAVHRALVSAKDSSMTFICIQSAQNSLKGYTQTDGKLCQDKAPWMA